MTTLLARTDTKAGTIMNPISARKLGTKGVTPQDAAIGIRVRSFRKERGMSQETLAKRLGLTFQQGQKYENGRNRIGSGRLVQIAGVLECPPAALLGTPEMHIEQSLGDKMTTTTRGCKLAADFIKLEFDAQMLLVNLAEWLVQVQGRKV